MKKNKLRKPVKLNKSQLKRLYDVFEFLGYEEILSATFNEDTQLEIIYEDITDGIINKYIPSLFRCEEDKEEDYKKIIYILSGIWL